MILETSGDFLKYDNTQDRDIVTIIDEGKIEHSEFLKKDLFNMKVDHNQKQKTYSPNIAAIKALQEAFGRDTKDWVGHQFEILHIDKSMKIRPIRAVKA